MVYFDRETDVPNIFERELIEIAGTMSFRIWPSERFELFIIQYLHLSDLKFINLCVLI